MSFLTVCWFASVCGCAAYQFGASALYPPGIATVHVPVVRNETFRPDLGIRLTEALVKEIEQRTPYKVVSNPNADSVLRCTIVYESKSVLTETENDDPRALDATVSVAANWTARDGRRLMMNSLATGQDDATGFSQSVRFVPEAGQSISTATQDAIDQLARRIVSQMENRW
ncbi:LPS assembly lipoprotein LptE [Roseiconus nitratireducens]|uniref:LPS assembly lipoprotein LptE n=1 Tax=Roseiconus nitratireducens TaxID=2605748 RepID=UPI001F384178|nr:LptE family protein [Roseiconus nitratireducens]